MSAIDYTDSAREGREMNDERETIKELLDECSAALDAVLSRYPALAGAYYQCGQGKATFGNLRAELFSYRGARTFGGEHK